METREKVANDTLPVFSARFRGGSHGKILFVDDEPAILQLYDEEFSEDGYKVVVATNGKGALMKY